MPVRHSVLALYGAVSDALADLNGPGLEEPGTGKVRRQARNIAGLTGSAGEIGWYGELFRFFDAHSTGVGDSAGPVLPPAFEDAVDEIRRIGDEGIVTDADGLQPSWASRAIEAAFVLDAVRRLENRDAAPVLDLVIAATPALPGFADGGTLGPSVGRAFADQLRAADDAGLIMSLNQLHNALDAPGSPLHAAIKTARMDARLRKVKDEYCAVVRTRVDWPDIHYDKILAGINPTNWDDYFTGFFCGMASPGLNDYGWTRIKEEVSGECGRYRLRTPLRFWSEKRGAGLFLNYDIERGDWWPEADPLVLVDNGYIWITKLDPNNGDHGVRVYTSKQLLISGLSATAFAVLARTMGYATNATDMFRKLQTYTDPLDAFMASAVGKTPPADNSATWPVVIPNLPADLRDEMCKDTNDLLHEGLDMANDQFAEYIGRWNDGIDVKDFNELTNAMSGRLRKLTKDVFTTATSNFRPKPGK